MPQQGSEVGQWLVDAVLAAVEERGLP